tara:strand:- start:444 stop:833 length:390 start_codon:yes stop_codon:yes gene_type:complete
MKKFDISHPHIGLPLALLLLLVATANLYPLVANDTQVMKGSLDNLVTYIAASLLLIFVSIVLAAPYKLVSHKTVIGLLLMSMTLPLTLAASALFVLNEQYIDALRVITIGEYLSFPLAMLIAYNIIYKK